MAENREGLDDLDAADIASMKSHGGNYAPEAVKAAHETVKSVSNFGNRSSDKAWSLAVPRNSMLAVTSGCFFNLAMCLEHRTELPGLRTGRFGVYLRKANNGLCNYWTLFCFQGTISAPLMARGQSKQKEA